MRAILTGYAGTKEFNKIGGNLYDVDFKSIALQLDLMQEEYLETVEAFDKKDNVELLDGAVDMVVIAFGLLQKLEVAGFDIATALNRVVANNISKYPHKTEALHFNSEENIAILNTEFNRYVIKNKNQKIMKPINFVPVKLGDLVPKYWKF